MHDQPRSATPTAPTAWAIKRRAAARPGAADCICGSPMSRCAGCGQARCLACDPYLSDDCRWPL